MQMNGLVFLHLAATYSFSWANLFLSTLAETEATRYNGTSVLSSGSGSWAAPSGSGSWNHRGLKAMQGASVNVQWKGSDTPWPWDANLTYHNYSDASNGTTLYTESLFDNDVTHRAKYLGWDLVKIQVWCLLTMLYPLCIILMSICLKWTMCLYKVVEVPMFSWCVECPL